MVPILILALIFGVVASEANPKSKAAVFESYKNTDDTVLYSEEKRDQNNNGQTPSFARPFQGTHNFHGHRVTSPNLQVSPSNSESVHKGLQSNLHNTPSTSVKPYAILHGTGELYSHDRYAPNYNIFPQAPQHQHNNHIGYNPYQGFGHPGSLNPGFNGYQSNIGYPSVSQTFLDPNRYRNFQNGFVYGGANNAFQRPFVNPFGQNGLGVPLQPFPIGYPQQFGQQGSGFIPGINQPSPYDNNGFAGNINFRGYLGYPNRDLTRG